MQWQATVRRIRNGMSVNELVANIPVNDLVARTDYLKTILEAFQAGHALTDQDAALTSDTYVGCAVYWSEADSAYAPALAAYDISDGGVVTPRATALARGIVLEKSGDNAGTVCLFGLVDGVDIQTATGDAPASGTWYVSSLTPGALVLQRPPLAIPLLFLSSATKFWVQPPGEGNANDHQHYSFNLFPEPAGIIDEPAPGDPFSFLEEWPEADGWLPADSENFAGMEIPDGTQFGYNIAADAALSAVWPPLPPESAKLFRDGMLIREGQVVINDDGIWWLTNCDGNVPFGRGSSDCAGISDPGCPPNWCDQDLQLFFTRFTGMSGDAFVTSLRGEAPVSVVSCTSGQPAIRGNLKIVLSAMTTAARAGGLPMLSSGVIDVSRTAVTTGPAVSGARGTGLASVVGTGPTYTDNEGNVYQSGGLQISLGDANNLNGGVDVVALSDVGETTYQGNLYYVLPADRESSLRGRISLPLSDLPASPVLTLYIWVVGEVEGAIQPLQLSYSRLARPTPGPTSLPTSDTELPDLAPGTTADTYQCICAAATPFAVAAGDVVHFTLARASGSGNIGILNMRWGISSGA